MIDNVAAPALNHPHPFAEFWNTRVQGKFACPTWPLEPLIQAKLDEKQALLAQQGYHLKFAHEFEFQLKPTRVPLAKTYWWGKRNELAVQVGNPKIKSYSEADVFNCDCYNDPRLAAIVEHRSGPGNHGQGYNDLAGIYEMRLKPASPQEQQENFRLFWKIIQEKLPHYNLRLVPGSIHTHGSLHRIGTDENMFSLAGADQNKCQLYARLLSALVATYAHGFAFLANRLENLERGVQANGHTFSAHLAKNTIIRPAYKTIEARSCQSPMRYDPALEYLTYITGILEGLNPLHADLHPAAVLARRGRFAVEGIETDPILDILESAPILDDGHLVPSKTLAGKERTKASLMNILRFKPNCTPEMIEEFFSKVRVEPTGRIHWPPTLPSMIGNIGQKARLEEARRALAKITCKEITPCAYIPKGVQILKSSPMRYEHAVLQLAATSPILKGHWGAELQHALVDAHQQELNDYDANLPVLLAARETRLTPPSWILCLPPSTETKEKRASLKR